jgi:hypothetical protein
VLKGIEKKKKKKKSIPQTLNQPKYTEQQNPHHRLLASHLLTVTPQSATPRPAHVYGYAIIAITIHRAHTSPSKKKLGRKGSRGGTNTNRLTHHPPQNPQSVNYIPAGPATKNNFKTILLP